MFEHLTHSRRYVVERPLMGRKERRKEGNALFNDALNTFYLS